MPEPDPSAQLSAIDHTLDDLTSRITTIAERLDRGATEGAAASLFDVERSLRAAKRSLARATRALR